MPDIKHVGRIKSTGRKCLIAYRTLPGESDSALVVQTEFLSDDQHDSIIKLVESSAGQSAYEFAEVLARARFPKGGVMLSTLHLEGRLTKVKTSEIEMIPNSRASIGLDQLNQIIAEQRGISVNDLALSNSTSIQEVAKVNDLADPVEFNEPITVDLPKEEQVLSDEDLAKKYRSDADRLSKEAAHLRRLAEELVPTKKKSTEKV